MQPHFIIIGEQKAGTGWLRDRLREHPQVFMPFREVNYFNRRVHLDRGMAWYEKHFEGAGGRTVVGEKSPEYFWLDSGREDYEPSIDAEIARQLPDVKLILLLRNPVDRAVSAFMHHLRHRGRRINPALLAEHRVIDLLLGDQQFMQRYGIVSRGYYAERLKRYRDRFGHQLLTLVFEEDVIADPQAGLGAVCSHLEINPDAARFQLRSNTKEAKPSLAAIRCGYWLPILRPVIRRVDFGTPYRATLTGEERQTLAERYRDDVSETRGLLGRDVWTQDWPL